MIYTVEEVDGNKKESELIKISYDDEDKFLTIKFDSCDPGVPPMTVMTKNVETLLRLMGKIKNLIE
jgi:hypothetical protein